MTAGTPVPGGASRGQDSLREASLPRPRRRTPPGVKSPLARSSGWGRVTRSAGAKHLPTPCRARSTRSTPSHRHGQSVAALGHRAEAAGCYRRTGSRQGRHGRKRQSDRRHRRRGSDAQPAGCAERPAARAVSPFSSSKTKTRSATMLKLAIEGAGARRCRSARSAGGRSGCCWSTRPVVVIHGPASAGKAMGCGVLKAAKESWIPTSR